jgi:hypothetical protein
MNDLPVSNSLPAFARSSGYGWRGTLLPLVAAAGLVFAGAAAAGPDKISFDMVVSAGAAACLPNATAHVEVHKKKGAEAMEIKVSGLRPDTGFNVFVIQKPTGPFGLSWYQGDITTNHEGKGHGRFLGRFNIETFIVAPGVAPAPQTHPGVDAVTNPQTAPVHTYHVGLWFDSPADAADANCPGTTTPFNGDHDAGIQVLNTSNFPDLAGPLSQLD